MHFSILWLHISLDRNYLNYLKAEPNMNQNLIIELRIRTLPLSTTSNTKGNIYGNANAKNPINVLNVRHRIFSALIFR